MDHISGLPLLSLAPAVACAILGLSYWLVRSAYPSPIPGIPYNRLAAKRLMGDIVELSERQKTAQGMRPWFLEQAHRHNSAITQIFLGPFAKPAVLISDYREVNDILSHRDAVDFKRGKKADVFHGLLPHAFPAMETFDPHFKVCRDLVRDLMAPSFLQSCNALRVYEVASTLVELWRTKARITQGRPFDGFNDIVEFSFDAILSAATGLGSAGGDVERQLLHLSTLNDTPACSLSGAADEPAVLPSADRSSNLSALAIEEELLWKAFYTPWPGLYYAINKLHSSVRHARRTLYAHIDEQVKTAAKRLAAGGEPESALDHVMQREMKAASKEGREPSFTDPRIHDNILGYLIAGHDTSTGSLLWLMQALVDHPDEQFKVRTDLYRTYNAAYREGRLPLAHELVKRSPYLDAFIEEVLRIHCPVVTIMVMTRYDTLILGHHVPAETQVFLNLTGPSLSRPSVPVDESARSETSRKHAPRRDNWDDADPESFRPGRWLRDEDGQPVFDASRGPALAFSAGNRGCWGKRLGHLELRIALTLLLWSFDLQAPTKMTSLETYDSLVTAPKQCLLRISERVH
ncbi:cytochrome P450 [Stachybotrys elegans]|uniref:Cytochrome P450 n=1 Tax=Stachybotrys elegans TaxID=80388 RepID=A0A8K0SWP7_9HYPO|nr:cytochrome P450 [Stachybotrys elegans]